MKAAIFHQFGPPEVLKYEDVPDPVAGPGEVVVEVRAVTVNRTLDVAVRRGEETRRDAKPPLVLGVDPSGTVAAVGAGVDTPSAAEQRDELWFDTTPVTIAANLVDKLRALWQAGH